jgi:hypothetical protein
LAETQDAGIAPDPDRQVANVLVNYDLSWNPMIVEQRIGRIQRLASEHAKVSILNLILRGTFEEYIVGRLMEKLQMASHAIGDIEALLEAAGIDDGRIQCQQSFLAVDVAVRIAIGERCDRRNGLAQFLSFG